MGRSKVYCVTVVVAVCDLPPLSTTGLQRLLSVCMESLCVTEEVVCFKTVYSRGLTPLLQGQLACAPGSILASFAIVI